MFIFVLVEAKFDTMSTKEIKALESGLLKQRRVAGRSKKAASKVLKELNIFHLLVPKGSQKDGNEAVVR